MSEWIKSIYKVLLILVVSIAVGLLGLLVVYSMPIEMSLNTLKGSIYIYEKEGAYPNWANGKASSMLDNFTDSIMLRNVIYPGSGSVLKDAVLNPKLDYKNCDTIQSLIVQLKGEDREYFVSYYPRYWHGYLIILKPLTCLINVSYIRLLNLILQMLVTAYLVFHLGIDLGKGVGISYLFTYLFFNPASLAMSMQFSSSFYVMSLILIVLLKWWNFFIRSNIFLYLFLVSGIATSYFDLLTYPLITLGIPLSVFFIKVYQKNCDDLKIEDRKKALRIVMSSSLFWFIGYGGMYFGKWLLAWYVTDFSVVVESLNQLQYRMSNYTSSYEGGQVITPVLAIIRNILMLCYEPISLVLLITWIFCLYKLNRIKKMSSCQDFKALKFGLRFIMLLPFIWYFLLCNHSFIHSFFTYRTLSILVFAEGCYITTCFREKSL